MPNPTRAPVVSLPVQFFEICDGKPAGPFAAIVTNADNWYLEKRGSVDLVVLGDMSLRFIPDVPFEDVDGSYAGCWWTWPTIPVGARQN